jgi:hypothetical protein
MVSPPELSVTMTSPPPEHAASSQMYAMNDASARGAVASATIRVIAKMIGSFFVNGVSP